MIVAMNRKVRAKPRMAWKVYWVTVMTAEEKMRLPAPLAEPSRRLMDTKEMLSRWNTRLPRPALVQPSRGSTQLYRGRRMKPAVRALGIRKRWKKGTLARM